MYRVLTVLFLLLIIGCDGKTKSKENTLKETLPKVQNQNQSEFILKTIDGKEIHTMEIENGIVFKELKGKVVFLVLFGYRCPPCLIEIPSFIELSKEHKDLEIVAIEVQGYDNDELKTFAKRKGIDYTLVSSYNSMDFIQYIQQKANWTGSIPFLIGLNKKGKVIIMHTGGVGKSVLEGAYQDLIKS